MANLLPKSEQDNLAHEYRLRFAAVALLLFGSLGTVALAALIPSLFLSHQKEVVIAKTFDTLSQDNTLDSKNKLEDVLVAAGKEIKALKFSSPAVSVYSLINDVIRAKSGNIKVSGIRVTKNQNGSHSIALIGQAKDRDSLVAFSKALEQEKDFTKVTVPVSNFVDSSNINYSITVDAI